MAQLEVPAHGTLVEPWRQQVRGGSIDDRTLREVETRVPGRIATIDVTVPGPLGVALDDALREITALDRTHGRHLAALATLLLRAESVASSKIERVEATVEDYARALHGSRANASATSMVASTTALVRLVDSVQHRGRLDLVDVHAAHRDLMADDPYERSHAGRARTMQNWIGGSDHSPRGALFVPPPPRMIDELLADLVDFANRDDVNVLVQASITHAQFESIHPYTDGNGRIGRALINSVLRRRGTTSRVVVPLASSIVAERDAYFSALGSYREGDVGPLVESFARAARLTAIEAMTSAERLAAMPDQWRQQIGPVRAGSATARILDTLLTAPVFAADDLAADVGGSTSSLYTAVQRLHEADVLRPLTTRRRNQVWIAGAIADELDDLGVRVADRTRREHA